MKKQILTTMILFFTATVVFGQSKSTLTVELTRGASYSQTVAMGLGKADITPHIAVWLESTKGEYLGTIFVSLKDGKQDFWVGNRPHPLPAWEKLAANKPLLDAVASASPAPKAPQALLFKKSLPTENNDYVIKIEVNMGFDYNKSYDQDRYNPWGQPSIIYSALINPSKPETKLLESPNAMVLPETKIMISNTEGITSAKDILKSIKISWN